MKGKAFGLQRSCCRDADSQTTINDFSNIHIRPAGLCELKVFVCVVSQGLCFHLSTHLSSEKALLKNGTGSHWSGA